MNPFLGGILTLLGSYLLGSFPSAVLVTRWVRGVDVRTVGSGHAGATNTLRAAGWLPALVVATLDLGKGFLAVELAFRWGETLGVLAAGAVVIGHCWPLFTRFRGGMGVATGAGALLATAPHGLVIAVGLEALLNLSLRHTARANVVTGLGLGPTFWLLGFDLSHVGVAVAVGVIVALRSRSDWDRSYGELWLDRERTD